MGEARARAKIDGYLTRREQITLGTVAIGFGRPDPGKQGSGGGGGSELRDKKVEAMLQLGVAFVGEQIQDRQGNPDYAGKPMWDKEQLSTEKVRFTIDKDLLAWVLTELDKVPAGSLDDAALHTIETRFKDMKSGDFKMPAELLGPVALAAAE